MSPTYRRTFHVLQRLLLVAALVLCANTALVQDVSGQDASSRFVGQSLEDALTTLRAEGLSLFFTTRVVRPDMRVQQEPTAEDLEGVLAELLTPHGLTTKPGPGGRRIIVEAEPAGVRGWVRDRRSTLSLSGVRLVMVGEGSGDEVELLTDASGGFHFTRIDPGKYALEAHLPGYVIQQIEGIRVAPFQISDIVVELEAILLALDEIVVTPSRMSLLSTEPVAALDLDRKDILALPHLGDDIFRALTLLPGVSGEEASARFNVRGGRTDEVLVLLDRVELYEPYHLKDYSSSLSIIPPRALQEVNLVTGGFSAQFGDRMGGVLEMTTRRPERNRRTLGLSILNVEAGGAGEFQQGRGHWIGLARRGALDLTLDFLGQKQKPFFWDAFGKLNYQLSDRQNLSLHALYSEDRLDALLLEPDTVENFLTSYSNAYFWLGHQGFIGSKTFVDSTLSVGRIEQDRRGDEAEFEGDFFDVRDERRLDVVSLKQDWNSQLSERSHLTWGFDLRSLDTLYDYSNVNNFGDVLVDIRNQPRPMTTRFVADLGGESYSAYLSSRRSLRDSLAVELGWRFDHHTLTDDGDFSPRINLVSTLGKASTLRLAWGLFHQSQRPYELQVPDGETQLGRSERTAQSVIGLEHSFSIGRRKSPLLMRFEAYHREVENPRPRFENLFEPVSEFPEIEADRFRLVPERSEAYGLELLLKGSLGSRTDWWVSYAYARTTDRIGGRNVPRRIDQPHTLNFDINYSLGDHWNLNMAWRYHTGWPITGVSGRFADPEDDDGEDGEDDGDGDEFDGEEDDDELDIIAVYGPINGERLPSYHRLDLRASREWELRRGTLGFFLEVQNVYDHGNVAGFDFDFEFQLSPAGDIEQQEILEIWGGILPSFGITWEF